MGPLAGPGEDAQMEAGVGPVSAHLRPQQGSSSPGCNPLCQMSPHHGAPLAHLSLDLTSPRWRAQCLILASCPAEQGLIMDEAGLWGPVGFQLKGRCVP